MVRTPEAERLDVTLLLDDQRGLEGREQAETFLFVSEAVDAIEASLERLGHRARRLSFDLGVAKVFERLDADRPDVVFHLGQPSPTDPSSEGKVTGMLDLLGIPHTSESTESLFLSGDKVRAKHYFAEHGIPTPPYAVSTRGELPDALPRGPWIAKPSLEDGSVGIVCEPPATERAELARRIRALHARFAQRILIETFMAGREFQVGIVGEELLPPVEIDFSGLPADRRLAGYQTKWKYSSSEYATTHYVCPARLTPDLGERLTQVAHRTRVAFGLRRCSRLDIRADESDALYVLDVNPNPDLSPLATVYKMAETAGWGFDGLVARMLRLALSGRERSLLAGSRA